MKDKYLRWKKRESWEPEGWQENVWFVESGGADQRQTDYASHFVILSRSLALSHRFLSVWSRGTNERWKAAGERETFRQGLLGRQYQKEWNAHTDTRTAYLSCNSIAIFTEAIKYFRKPRNVNLIDLENSSRVLDAWWFSKAFPGGQKFLYWPHILFSIVKNGACPTLIKSKFKT